jgi:hypothetical protein
MKVGNLIEFRNCAYTGKTGIITRLTKPSELAKTDPALRLYWVFSGGSECCYTGNQLVLLA